MKKAKKTKGRILAVTLGAALLMSTFSMTPALAASGTVSSGAASSPSDTVSGAEQAAASAEDASYGTASAASGGADTDSNSAGTAAATASVPAAVLPTPTTGALEDQNGIIAARNGASLVDDGHGGKMLSVTSGWISGGTSATNGGGAFVSPDNYFKKSSFTLFVDVTIEDQSDSTNAVLIGNATNLIQLNPLRTDGSAILQVVCNGNTKTYTLTKSLALNTKATLAFVYSEGATQGNITVYLDGEEVVPTTGIGFKMSQQSGIVAGFGNKFATGFMRTGTYDNIKVADETATVSTALQNAVAQAQALDSTIYAPATYAAVVEKMQAAQAVLAEGTPSYDALSAALSGLYDAIDALVNLTDLRASIAKAEAVEADGKSYATISKSNLDDALKTARILAGNTLPDGLVLTQAMVDSTKTRLDAVVGAMVVKNVNEHRYTSVPVGDTWLDTEGAPIQAHGGGFLQQTDTDGKPIYYWVGEDKTHNGASFNGVSLYSSKDLVNWTYRGALLRPDPTDPGLFSNTIERPKLLYNEKTKKYVLWGHWEGSGYSSSQVCVATADKADGPYTFLGHWRPGASDAKDANGTYLYRDWGVRADGTHFDDGTPITDYSDTSLWGNGSRDFTLYMEPNGTDAYLVSTQDSTRMRIYKLNDDFTDVVSSYVLFDGARREAPALVKSGDYYYLITSKQAGWYPNQARYSYTKDISDPNGWAVASDGYTPIGTAGDLSTYYSQATSIMSLTGTKGTTYIYMADRWKPHGLGSSTYVWLPLTIDDKTNPDAPTLSIDYHYSWSLDTNTAEVTVHDDGVISNGKPATSSVATADGRGPEMADDGDYSTRYQPTSLPFTYTIDLGAGEDKVYDLSHIDLSFPITSGSEAYSQYTIETSVNGVNWTQAVDESANVEVGFKSHALSGQGRYVRINVTKVHDDVHNTDITWGAGFMEVRVYGKESTLRSSTSTGLTAQAFKLAYLNAVNNVQLKWETAPAATEYRVYRAESEAALATSDPIYTGTADNWADIGLPAANKTYYYQIRGYYNGQLASESSVAKAATYARVPDGMSVYDSSTGAGMDLGGGIEVGGVNYSYSFQSDDNGFACIMERESTDGGKTWTDTGKVLERSDSKADELASCKFESVSTLYNPKTQKVVIWAHYELKSGYGTGAVVSLSGTPGDPGSFQYSGLIFPNGTQARDKTVFVDTDGTAYLITAGNLPGESANKTIYIHKLTEDWTAIQPVGTTGYVTKLFDGQYREAPAMLKDDNGYYYLFTSQAAGWLPSQGMYASASSITGTWSELKAPAEASSFSTQQNGAAIVKGTQATSALLMGSRWWRSADSAGWQCFPLALNDGYATADYYEKIYYNTATGVFIPEQTGELLSQGKNTTFKDAAAPETVDGDYTTMTTASAGWPADWVVDLEKPVTLSDIQISWNLIKGSEAYYPYKVYGSLDGQNYDLLLDRSAVPDSVNSADYGFTAEHLTGKYRYVKVEIITARPQNNPGNPWPAPRLWEVKVFGDSTNGKAPLQELYNVNKDKAQENYTDESWAAFAAARDVAKTVLDSENVEQAVIDAVKASLQAAADALTEKIVVTPVDKEELHALYDANKDKTQGTYTDASWKVFSAARDAAKNVLESTAADQTVVDAIRNTFQAAIEGLTEKVIDKTALQTLYDANENRANDRYTDASWQAFGSALKTAQDVLKAADAAQAQVDEALQTLTAAVNGLTKNTPGGSGSGTPSDSSSPMILNDPATGTRVTVPGDALSDGVSPEEVTLVVTPVISGAAFERARQILAEVGANLAIYDISLMAGSTKIEPNGSVQVFLPIPDGFDPNRVEVYRINGDGTRTQMSGKAENGLFVFTTDHFSTYALVEADTALSAPSSAADTGSVGNPETGKNPEDALPAFLLALAALIGGAAAFALKRRFRGN